MAEKISKKLKDKTPDANPDPITGAPGAHPVGTGVGAAAGGAAAIAGAAAAGAAAGTAVGPVGTAVGAAVGAVVGGLAGKAVAEKVNPTAEDAYWRENYRNEPYYNRDYTYDDYSGAYRTGWEGYSRHAATGKSYEDIEPDLQQKYEQGYSGRKLDWLKARPAVRAAWERCDSCYDETGNRMNPDEAAAADEIRDRETRPRSERQREPLK